MLESARRVKGYVAGVSFEEFWENGEKRDAVALRLAAIGESARRITPETAAKLPKVPFKEIQGMRHRIAHEYDQVDHRIVWQVVTKDLEPLIASLSQHLGPRK